MTENNDQSTAANTPAVTDSNNLGKSDTSVGSLEIKVDKPSEQGQLKEELKRLRRSARTAATQAENAARKAVRVVENVESQLQTALAHLDDVTNEIVEKSTELKTLQDQIVETQESHRQLTELAAYFDEYDPQAEEALSRLQEIVAGAEERSHELEGSSESASEILQAVADIRTEVQADRSSLKKALSRAENHASATAKFAAECEANSKQIDELRHQEGKERQQFLEFRSKTEEKVNELLSKSEQVLRGSTSASLSAAYDGDAKRSRRAMLGWFLAIVILAASACVTMIYVVQTSNVPEEMDWPSFITAWGPRWVVAVVLVTLLVFAMRHFRVVRNEYLVYNHKATASRAFEGYRREISEIDEGRHLAAFVSRAIDVFALNSLSLTKTTRAPSSNGISRKEPKPASSHSTPSSEAPPTSGDASEQDE